MRPAAKRHTCGVESGDWGFGKSGNQRAARLLQYVHFNRIRPGQLVR